MIDNPHAKDVADYLLASAHEHGSFMSNLKLQKMLYYAQGWHLGIFGTPLFPEKFQAWVHGPVVPSIYQVFKPYAWRNIDTEVVKPEFSKETTEFLDELFGEYINIDAYQLERMTHHELPWLSARGNLPIDAPSSAELDEGLMRSHFAPLVKHEG